MSQALSESPEVSQLPGLSDEARAKVLALEGADEAVAERVKEVERTTNHDVKAVEYVIKVSHGLNVGWCVRYYVTYACSKGVVPQLLHALSLSQLATRSVCYTPCHTLILSR